MAEPWWGPAQEDPYKPHTTRCQAGDILWGAAQTMTPAVSSAIFKRGLVEPLLEVSYPLTAIMFCAVAPTVQDAPMLPCVSCH